jgi:hypothetical protein
MKTFGSVNSAGDEMEAMMCQRIIHEEDAANDCTLSYAALQGAAYKVPHTAVQHTVNR